MNEIDLCYLETKYPHQIIDRFWSKINIRGIDECWEWNACRDEYGYGRFGTNHWTSLAHRVAWEIANWEKLGKYCALHKCDNPPCCNPGHLWKGTRPDNALDMKQKGRGNAPSGERHRSAKLTWPDVRKIRKLYSHGVLAHNLALRFGIAERNIYEITNGHHWKERPHCEQNEAH